MNPISITEAARATGLSRAVLSKWCRAGLIPGAFKVGTQWALPAGWQRPTTKVGRPAKTQDEAK